MKNAHIGLVALAAMVIAGCGGGSDNGSGGAGGTQSSPVPLSGVTGFLLGSDNEREIELKSGNNPGPGGSNLRCTPATGSSGCTLTISRAASGGAITARATGGTVRVTPPSASNNNDDRIEVLEDDIEKLEDDIVDKDAEIADLKNQVSDADNRAENKQRAPMWIIELNEASSLTDTSDYNATGDVTVEHERPKSSPTFQPTALSRYNGPRTSLSDFSGWRGSRFTSRAADHRDDDIQRVYLYTNIGSPSSSGRDFWKVVPADSDTTLQGYQVSIAAGSEREKDATGSRVTPILLGGSTTMYTGLSVTGSLGGVRGTFTCDCGGNSGGEALPDPLDWSTYVTFPNGKPDFQVEWVFSTTSSTVDYSRPQDETYLYFGFWEEEQGDATAAPDFKWIASGGETAGADLENLDDLNGSASFDGGVIGRYAIKGGQADTDIFTAKVNLTATFDDTDTVGGSITGFEVNGESMPSTEWGLDLEGTGGAQSATLTSGSVGADAGIVAGRIDGITVEGSWFATLYGVDNTGTPPAGASCKSGTTDMCAVDLAGFAGRFNASGSVSTGTGVDPDVAIAGAFAAD